MTGPEHFRAAERLLKSCQVPGYEHLEAEQYPALEDSVDSVAHALAAAQVHATLALTAAQIDTAIATDADTDDLGDWPAVTA